MKYLVIDTETNALPDYGRSAEAEGQPRLAEFCGIIVDEQGDTIEEWQRYVQPGIGPDGKDRWCMEPGATEVNKITDDLLREKGTSILEVLDWYVSRIIIDRMPVVAYGAQFDTKIMRGELRRAEALACETEQRAFNEECDLFEETLNTCLMRQARPFAKMIGREIVKAGGNNKGWPKLTDFCDFLGVIYDKDSMHGATADARAAATCFRLMLDQGFDPAPSIHRSKNYEAIKGAK
jgi:DNA polymerase III epsilon subunit-like protein